MTEKEAIYHQTNSRLSGKVVFVIEGEENYLSDSDSWYDEGGFARARAIMKNKTLWRFHPDGSVERDGWKYVGLCAVSDSLTDFPKGDESGQ